MVCDGDTQPQHEELTFLMAMLNIAEYVRI